MNRVRQLRSHDLPAALGHCGEEGSSSSLGGMDTQEAKCTPTKASMLLSFQGDT